MNRERVGRRIAENLPHLTEPELRYARIMWSGGSVAMTVETALAGGEAEFWTAAEFIVRWNLRASGVADAEIDEAIKTAYAAMGSPRAT
jgi:hypothetical protein